MALNDQEATQYLDTPIKEPKTELYVNGSLAIKAHASRIKVMTSKLDQYGDEETSQKTSSTFFTNIGDYQQFKNKDLDEGYSSDIAEPEEADLQVLQQQ